MARSDLSIRSIPRFEGMAKNYLKKGEDVQAALPVWLGGTYLPFFLSIVIGVGVGTSVGSAIGPNSFLYTIIGGVLGAFLGNLLAKRRARQHPVDAGRLQVYLAVTGRRILVHESGGMGRPGGLRSELLLKNLDDATVRRGGFFKPARLTLTVDGVDYGYEYSGLWQVPGLLEKLNAS